jgi:hypothetical protein
VSAYFADSVTARIRQKQLRKLLADIAADAGPPDAPIDSGPLRSASTDGRHRPPHRGTHAIERGNRRMQALLDEAPRRRRPADDSDGRPGTSLERHSPPGSLPRLDNRTKAIAALLGPLETR